jgi:hypothetical protein
VQAGLKFYVGAANLGDDGGYAEKVMAEHARLQQVANGRAVPLAAPSTLRTMAPAKPQPTEEVAAAPVIS